jgi:sugar lactone lactonase YvrE
MNRNFKMRAGIMRTAILSGLVVLLLAPSQAHSQSPFDGPESANYDTFRDRYFISNADGRYIVEINSDRDTSVYYTATNRLLGTVIVNDTLFVSATNRILGFELATDSLVISAYIPGASELNDVTADTSGFLYITDISGFKVYKMRISDQSTSTIVSGIYMPNGILFDAENNSLLVCSFGSNAPIRSVSLDGLSVTVLITTPFSNLDGLAEDNDGNIYVSSFSGNAVYRYDRAFTDPPLLVSDGHSGPADVFFDKVNNILVVPNYYSDAVDFLDMDVDSDAVLNLDDNCPSDPNPGQSDGDNDGVGDVCDNCVDVFNPGQADSDQDNIGDACDYICGDTDASESVDIDDVVQLIQYIFGSGLPPEPFEAGDADCSGSVDIDDVVYLISYIFAAGSSPCDTDGDGVPDC